MACKNNKFLKYGCLICAIVCFAFLPLLALKPINAHALSTPNHRNELLDTAQISPFRNMTITTVGNRHNAVNYDFKTGYVGISPDTYFIRLMQLGNSTKYFTLNEFQAQDINTHSALYNYENNIYQRGGVLTTLDGLVSGDNPYSNTYYDYDGSYKLSQNFNSQNNKLELNAYNTNNFTIRTVSPRVIYSNSMFTNFDFQIGSYGKYTYNGDKSLDPDDFMHDNGFTTEQENVNGVVNMHPNKPSYLKSYYFYCEHYDIDDDNWSNFDSFVNELLDYTNYIKTEVTVGLIDNYGNEHKETFTYINYGNMDYTNNGYTGRHTIPLNNDLQNYIYVYGLMRNYCVMFTEFTISNTYYCDNGTYGKYDDDFIIDCGNMFLDLPFYNKTDGYTITTNEILQSEIDAMEYFTGEIINDKVTFLNLFNEIFEFEIIKGFKLSYLVILSLGTVLIIVFVRFFR